MTSGVLRSSMLALTLAASLGPAIPTAAVAFPASSPMTVAATANAGNPVKTVAWRRTWRHRRYGWGPGAAIAGAALGVIGLGFAGAYYDNPYGCYPYDPYNYGGCGANYYGDYGYGYPYGYGYGRGFRGNHRFGGARVGGFGHNGFARGGFGHGGGQWVHGGHR